jgi:hypothetical protein
MEEVAASHALLSFGLHFKQGEASRATAPNDHLIVVNQQFTLGG